MREEKTNTLVIETPEGISFSLPLAGPLTRFFAWAIDFACINAIFWVLSILFFTLNIISPDFAGATLTITYFAVSIGYGILLEWSFRGQTLGKRILRLRVMDVQGLRLQFSQVVIRNLLRFVDSLPAFYFVGGLACTLSRRAQRLGDYAANTIVIRIKAVPEYDVQALATDKYNSFREYPHLEARLRQRVSPDETALILQAIMRRGELAPHARVELFKEIADHLRSLVDFPEEATFGLADEQYVRNAVDSMFRGHAKEQPATESASSKDPEASALTG